LRKGEDRRKSQQAKNMKWTGHWGAVMIGDGGGECQEGSY
jgi:hypothetical protein